MAVPDLTWISKTASVLRSLPIWFFVACAACGYAFLLLPSFGGAELSEIRNQWSWIPWSDAVGMSIFVIVKVADYGIKTICDSILKSRRREGSNARICLDQVYQPLMNQIVPLHIETSSGMGAPRFRHRLSNAKDELTNYAKPSVALKKAFRALWDRQTLTKTGEVSFGGSFPRDKITFIVTSKMRFCDEKLVTLAKRAERRSIEDPLGQNFLSEEDCELIDHIYDEYYRLKNYF